MSWARKALFQHWRRKAPMVMGHSVTAIYRHHGFEAFAASRTDVLLALQPWSHQLWVIKTRMYGPQNELGTPDS